MDLGRPIGIPIGRHSDPTRTLQSDRISDPFRIRVWLLGWHRHYWQSQVASAEIVILTRRDDEFRLFNTDSKFRISSTYPAPASFMADKKRVEKYHKFLPLILRSRKTRSPAREMDSASLTSDILTHHSPEYSFGRKKRSQPVQYGCGQKLKGSSCSPFCSSDQAAASVQSKNEEKPELPSSLNQRQGTSSDMSVRTVVSHVDSNLFLSSMDLIPPHFPRLRGMLGPFLLNGSINENSTNTKHADFSYQSNKPHTATSNISVADHRNVDVIHCGILSPNKIPVVVETFSQDAAVDPVSTNDTAVSLCVSPLHSDEIRDTDNQENAGSSAHDPDAGDSESQDKFYKFIKYMADFHPNYDWQRDYALFDQYIRINIEEFATQHESQQEFPM